MCNIRHRQFDLVLLRHPVWFGPDMPNDDLVEAMRPVIDAYIAAEVLPHVSDAWVDYTKTKVGYEIPITRHFYVYKPPRPLADIETDITTLEGEIAGLLKGLVLAIFNTAANYLPGSVTHPLAGGPIG